MNEVSFTDPTHPPVPQRRTTDAAVEHLHGCVEALKADMTAVRADLRVNTDTTTEMRDILKSFALFGKFAKWFSYVAAGISALIALVRQLKGG